MCFIIYMNLIVCAALGLEVGHVTYTHRLCDCASVPAKCVAL